MSNSVRHYRLSRRIISSTTHTLGGTSSAHPASVPRRPHWTPNEQATGVVHLSLPGLRCGVTMISSSSFVSCRSAARLDRLIATLPLDGEFELEEVYRRRGHPTDVAVYRWHKAAGSRDWTGES